MKMMKMMKMTYETSSDEYEQRNSKQNNIKNKNYKLKVHILIF